MIYFSLDILLIIGAQISSVVPGNTVDSNITTLWFFIFFATKIVAFFRSLKSGSLFFFIGVGTAIIKKSAFFI